MSEQPEIQEEMEEVLEDTPPEKTPEEQEEVKKRNRISANKKIRQQRWEIGERDREIERLKQEIETSKASSPTLDIQRPKAEDYEDTEQFHKALDDYADKKADAKAEQKAKEREDAYKKKRLEEERQRESEAFAQKWAKKQAAAVKAHSDFLQVESALVQDIKSYKVPHLIEQIIDSEQDTELVYYLGKNEEELERIALLSPTAAAREIGKIELKLSKPKQKNPPPPPNKIRGGGTSIDPRHESQEEYNRRKNGFK